MRIRIPSKRICEKFHLTYELKGAQKGVDVLTKYYRVRKMKIILDGRVVMKGHEADYFENIAAFTKRGLKRRNVLHELYHHVLEVRGIELSGKEEEKEANLFARQVMKKIREVMRKSW